MFYTGFTARSFDKTHPGILTLQIQRKICILSWHLVAAQLYKAMVMESLTEELTGRVGKIETRKRYARGYRMQTL